MTPDPEKYTVLGLDASHYQGGELDMHEAYKDGKIRFWFEKATEGLSTDGTFSERQPRIRSVFPVRGWYLFVHSSVDANLQADHYCSVVGRIEANEYVALDIEDGFGDLSGSDGIDFILKLAARIKRNLSITDDQIVIYGSLGWMRGQFGDALSGLARFHLWVARYNSTIGNVSPWSGALFWQNGEFGTVPGVGSGNMDTDRALAKVLPVAS